MKILILSAATGAGHLRASRAISNYILEKEPGSQVEVVDAMKSIGSLLDKTVCDGYHNLAMKTPKLFGKLYRATNKRSALSDLLSRFSNAFSRLLLPTIEESNPDAIISTHPFVSEMVSHLKAVGAVNAPLITLMTDYGPHLAWIADHADAYVVANADMIPQMESMGVDREKIYPFGIPVENVFFTTADRPALRKKFNLDPNLPTVLIMAGSFGVTNILNIYRQITHTDVPFQVVVITGKNEKLYTAFADEVGKSPKKTKLVFFTNEVENYMHASDLLVTKPGGLTVSEALACNVPLAVFDAIPGQEEDNADFLLSHNMAVKLEPGADCGVTILSLLEDNRRLDEMRSSCAEFDKSHSTENILALTRELCEKYEKTKPSVESRAEKAAALKAETAKRIFKAAHLTGKFTLRSGQISDEYFDKYLFEAEPKLLLEIAKIMKELIPHDTEILAGLEMGGIPIATALSLETGIKSAFVRKQAKEYGTCKLAEGADVNGKKVCVIEDVVTTGGQILKSVAELRSRGAEVDTVLCVIQRAEEASEILAKEGLTLKPAFTMEYLKEQAEK